MRYERNIRFLIVILLVSLVILATWFYRHSQVNTLDYQSHVDDVVKIEHLSASLIQQVLLVQNGDVSHFDHVARFESELETQIRACESKHGKTHPLLVSAKGLLNNISKIKAMYAVYKNSLLYFPQGTQSFLNSASGELDATIRSQIKALEYDVILFASTHNLKSQKSILDKLTLLRFSLQSLPNHHERALSNLLNHARKLSSLIIKLNEINNKLLDNDIPQIAQNMLLKLNLGFEEKVRKAAQVKQWFFVSIIALIVVLIIIWNKERSALTQLRNHAKELQLAGNVFKETHEGIMVTDSQKKILDVNPAFSEITGYSKDEIIGKDPKILSSGKQSKDFYQTMWNWLNEHDFWKGEIWNRNKGGELYAQVLTISVIRNTYGDIINYVGIFSDITAQKEQHEKLQLMAHYDLLTKLPNRALLSDRFNQAVAHSKRTSTQLAICFIDLDHFKPINDTYGHEIGDQLLIQVANRIKSSIREEDTVSRQGGDEFVLLISDVESVDECNYLMDRIHKNLAEPYLINDVTHTISASSGLTLFPSDDGDLDTLLRHADHAMYKAKQSGRNRMSLFNPELDQEQFARHHQLNAIELGLENNEFVLHYQPKISMVTGQVVGCEALIRWQPTNGQIIPPCEFLPIIDGTDVEIALGNWVIEQALFQIETWLEAGVELEVSVNISSHHLLSEGFIDSLQQQLTLHPTVNTRLLQIEVLESSALGDLDTVRKILNHCLYELGVKIALDDFGTGYSSLTHLRNLPVDTIKIDQSFVRNMINDINDYVIIDGVIALSSSFGRSVIAEGVETIEHGMMLLLMGCEFAQGYAISKPLEPEHFITWLHDFILPPEWKELSAMPLNQEKKETTLFGLVSDEWASIYKKQRILRV